MTASAFRGSPTLRCPVCWDGDYYSISCFFAKNKHPEKRQSSLYGFSDNLRTPSTVTHKSAFRVKPDHPEHELKQDFMVTKKVHFDHLPQKTRRYFPADASSILTSESFSSAGGVSEAETAYDSHLRLTRGRGGCMVNSSFSPPSAWQPIRLESLGLLSSGRSIRGIVAVLNIAFQKEVSARFTVDEWKTSSNVATEHCHSVYVRNSIVCDFFNFIIDKDSLPLETRGELQICACYRVLDHEFWDNNGGKNYRVAVVV